MKRASRQARRQTEKELGRTWPRLASLLCAIPQKYVLYLAAKIAVAIVVTCALEALLISFYPRAHKPTPLFGTKFTWGVLVFFVATFVICWIGTFLLFWAWWDHRHRCRTCLRKLIMPVESGSWGNMVMRGRPRIQYICPFGHGTLSEDEVHLAGRHRPQWQPHDDNIWKELESYGQAGRNRR